jgi:hypothetical protein
MNICVRKTCNLFERKGSHTFCVSKAFIRIEEDGSEVIKHIDLKASGVAVCNKIDEYNLEFGKALAQSRADKRLDRKIEKFLIKLSEKNVKAKRIITTANKFVGKLAVRTEKVKSGDGSFCTTPIMILKVTNNHIVYRWKPDYCEYFTKEAILSGEWLDDKWTSYDELMEGVI